eukprot:767648-Hanusia_phi.AAC.2
MGTLLERLRHGRPPRPRPRPGPAESTVRPPGRPRPPSYSLRLSHGGTTVLERRRGAGAAAGGR